MQKRIVLSLGIFTFLSVGVSTAYLFTANTDESPSRHSITEKKVQEKKTFETMFPTKITSPTQSLILGTVLSNETANVYSRREGIVQDVFVDIGDQVKEGQVVASLLPEGVEGESQARIEQKIAQKRQADIEARNISIVANQAIANAEQKVQEMETALNTMIETSKALIQTSSIHATTTFAEEREKVRNAEQSIKISHAQISTLEENIIRANEDKNRKLEKAEKNIDQMIEQAEVTTVHMRQTIEQVLLGEVRLGGITGTELDESDIPFELGAQKQQSRIDVVTEFNNVTSIENTFRSYDASTKRLHIDNYMSKALSLAYSTEEMLQGTITHAHFKQENLTRITNNVHAAKNSLLQAKEKVENARLALDILLTSEAEVVSNLEQKLLEEKEKLNAVKQNLELTKAQQYKNTNISNEQRKQTEIVQNSQIELQREKLESAKYNLEYVRSMQQKNIAAAQESIRVAHSALKTEMTQGNHKEVISPFTGIVSKRFINVGEMVSTKTPSFELIDVPTALSQKAKREIQFGLPEELNSELDIGDTIEFFLLNDSETIHTGTVTRKSPQVDTQTHTIITQAKIDNDIELPHHSSVRIQLTDQHTNMYSIPSLSIKRENGKNFIWIVNNETNTPKKIQVEVIAEDGEFAEVRGEIDENTAVIIEPINDTPLQKENDK